jgi:branched-chain amino acid transport system permease protein
VDVTLQVLVSGLAAGAVYGLVGVGNSLVYRLTGVIHFAFGELIALAVFATLFFAAGTGPVTQTSVGGGRFLLALVGGLAVAAAASAGAYWFAVQPYQLRGSTIGWVGASLAVAFALRTLIVAIFDRPSYVFPDPLPFRDIGDEGFWHVGGATIQVRSLFVIAVALALVGVAAWILTRTRIGRALEAISSDVDAAAVVGLPVSRLVGAAFALAGVVAGLAAIVAAPSGAFDVDTAALIGLKGLAAAVVVRFALWPSFVAGVAFGLLEAGIANTSWAGPSYREVVPLALVLTVLAVRGLRRPEAEAAA